MAKAKETADNVIPLQRQSGSNITALKKDIGDISNAIIAAKVRRKEINDEIAALRSKAKTMGIHKKALDLAIAYREWDTEQRETFDESYMIAREANGVIFHAQLDMFDAEQDANPRSDPDNGGAKPGDGSAADLGKGLNFDNAAEQAEGEAVLAR